MKLQSHLRLEMVRMLQMLRLFLGEGDQYSAWEDLPLASMSWFEMPAPLEVISQNAVLNFTRRRKLKEQFPAYKLVAQSGTHI